MSEIDRFRPDDRRGVDTLYRRTHGPDAAEANRLRWDWQHRRNPYNPGGQPGIWVAREGPTVVGHYPTLPVRISLKALEVEGAWGTGAMVAPERDSQGLDEALLRAWDRNSGAVLTLGGPGASRRMLEPPHVRYSVVALKRQGEVHGYAVYRHRHEPLGRVTMLVDFLVDPEDVSGLKTLLRWVDRAARAEDSDKVRCYVMNGAFRRVLRRNGYFNVKSSIEVAVKVNAVQ